ncbi:addiction module toxin RelE [Treponema medium]|uniref:type II toxin-antitoxin system RelE/ParE family toxin n=1 Tax=Treponema medium TaxID=58231 RepID=UPI00198233A4|nr:type II toxin-antitoxin system RelE/ParE family toxin [Treponema medium]QSH91572.1 addiction module toxin RelE [Treponema medium]
MIREFIITKEFDRMWKLLGLDDDDLSSLEIYLCKNPKLGDVMEGTGGIRKLRWALAGKGKSGGVRVIYFDIAFSKHIYLLTAFPKNLKENLSRRERNQMKNLVDAIKNAEKEANYGRG